MKLLLPTRRARLASESGFTMVEIAMALAIIGFALVAIIGVLPTGMDVQKTNRRETIINEDANYLLESLRGGARGLDNLVDYVTAIVVSNQTTGDLVTYTNPFTPPPTSLPIINPGAWLLDSGSNIVGLLSTPKYMTNLLTGDLNTNYVVAYIRAISGSAVEKFPQDNAVIKEGAFTYRMVSEMIPFNPGNGTNGFYHPSWTNYAAYDIITNAPIAQVDQAVGAWATNVYYNADVVSYLTNGIAGTTPLSSNDLAQIDLRLFREVTDHWLVTRNLQPNLYDLRLLFLWPVLPGNHLGNGRQVYRAMINGSLTNDPGGSPFWFVRPQTYLKAN